MHLAYSSRVPRPGDVTCTSCSLRHNSFYFHEDETNIEFQINKQKFTLIWQEVKDLNGPK